MFPRPNDRPPSRRGRLLAALAVAILGGAVQFWLAQTTAAPGDVHPLWHGTRLLAAGYDPYALGGVGGRWPLVYPLTALLAFAPLAWLPVAWATAAFAALSAGAYSYAVTARGWWPLFALASYAGVTAVSFAQWELLLSAAALTPALGWALAAKPTTGLALALAAPRPSRVRWMAAGLMVAAALAVGLALAPSWPAEWWANAHAVRHLRAPAALLPFGPAVVVVALLRWRRPEARLVALLACVPQTTLQYSALPLFLVAETSGEAAALAALSWVAFALTPAPTHVRYDDPAFLASFSAWAPTVGHVLVPLLYLPAALFVLRRPNESAKHEPRLSA